ncbi:type IV secretion system protein [Patescibacteria group bacterium]|nr:type IV secretion system protein [Patescibacteria group bacterium]
MTRLRQLNFLYCLSLCLVVLVLVLPTLVSAQQGGAPVTASEQNTLMMRVLWWIVASVFGGLTWATGLLLDYSIRELVINFGSLYQTSGLGVAVNNLWGVVRDLFNLTFIFGLIYIGFRMIINSDDSGAKKAIVNLIIAALLVNFSLFITKTVIDFSNIAAVQITQVIYRGGTATNQSISVAFGVQMGLSSLWGQTQEQANTARLQTGGDLPGQGGLLYIFGAMILFLIAAFCFAAGAILLFVRFIALNIMMILSPIMFLGRVFEPLQTYSSAYWKKFLSYCFFAPAFLLMLYFSLYILGQFTGSIRNSSGLAAELGPGATGVNAIAALLMSGGFLIASVLVAQKMSGAAGSMTVKVGNNLRERGQRMIGASTFGAGAYVGQRTLGRASARLSDSDTMKNWASRNPTMGRAALKVTSAVGDASFDGRAALAAAGVKGLGSATKGGYETRMKEAAKSDREFADTLGEQKLADAATQAGRTERASQIAPAIATIKADSTTEGTAGYELKQTETKQANARTVTLAANNELSSIQQNSRAAQEPELQKIALYQEQLAAATDPTVIASLKDKIKASTDKAKEIEGNFDTATKAAQQKVTAAQAAEKGIEAQIKSINDKIAKQAEARFTYARQLTLIESRKKSRDRYTVKLPRAVSGGAGAAGAAAAGAGLYAAGTAGAGALALGSVVNSYGESYGAQVEALEKTYGKDGTKKIKASEQKNKMKELGEVLKEEGVIPKEKKADKDD